MRFGGFRWFGPVIAVALLSVVLVPSSSAQDDGPDAEAPLSEAEALAADPGEYPDVDPKLPAGANGSDGPGAAPREALPATVDNLNLELSRKGVDAQKLVSEPVRGKGAVTGLGEGPVRLEVESGVADGSVAEVEILEPDLAKQVSPVGMAALVEFQAQGRKADSAGVFEVELSLDDVSVPYGAGAMERLKLVWYTDCRVSDGEVLCQSEQLLDTRVDTDGSAQGLVDVRC